MERLHMNHIREIIYRLRHGQSGRQIAKDLRVSRHTVSKYRQMAKEEGYLNGDPDLLSNKDLVEKLGPAKGPPRG